MTRLLSHWWIALLLGLFTATLSLGPIIDLKITQVFEDMRTIRFAIDRFRTLHGAIPTKEQGLESLVTSGTLDHPGKDPWGSSFVYSPRADGGYTLYSVGIDGRDDRGGGDDVTTPDKSYRCEDYEVNCLNPRPLVNRISFCVVFISLLVGIARGAFQVWNHLAGRRV